MIARQTQQLLRARPVDGLRERLERGARELAHVPVAREAHLGECDDLRARAGGLGHKVPDAAEVVRLVARSVLKLDRRHTDVAHYLIVAPTRPASAASVVCAAFSPSRKSLSL